MLSAVVARVQGFMGALPCVSRERHEHEGHRGPPVPSEHRGGAGPALLLGSSTGPPRGTRAACKQQFLLIFEVYIDLYHILCFIDFYRFYLFSFVSIGFY